MGILFNNNINYRKQEVREQDLRDLDILCAKAHEVFEGRDQFGGYDLFLLEYYLNELRNEWQKQN